MRDREIEEMIDKEKRDRDMHRLEEHEIATLKRYIDDKIPTGGFVEAVLRNDLKEALGRADLNNRRRIFEWVEWLYNYAPSICWGSPDKVANWLSSVNEQNNDNPDER